MKQKNSYFFILSFTIMTLLSCNSNHSSKSHAPDERIEQRSEHQIRIERDGSTEYADQYKEAEKLLSENKIEEAIKIFTHLCEIEKREAKPFALTGLAFAYNKKQAYEKALSCYEEAIKINPKDATLYNGLASTYAQLKKYDTAISCYRTVLEINANDLDGNLGLALMYANTGKTDSAKIYAKRFLALKPDTEYRTEMEEIIGRKK